MSEPKLVLLSALFLLPALSAWAQLSPPQMDQIHALVVRDVPEGAPGVAFGIVQDGKVLYTDYAGFADLTDSLPIQGSTRFNIASNGKQFTALAVLRLIQQGKLDLDEDIRTFFPGLLPAVSGPMTIRHLLTHRSGIRDIYELLSLQGKTWWKFTLSNQDVVDLLSQQQGLNFPPGTAYLYSNSNYILLAEIVARVSGESFSVFMQDLFEELGMNSTRFESDYQQIHAPIARPYFNFQTWTTYDWIWNVVGDGNLFTSMEDQLRFEQLLQSSDASVLSEELIQESQQRIPGGEDYGYGVEFSSYRGHPVVYHHGSTGAWKATVMRFPDLNLSLITMSNSGKTDVVDQNQRIADILLQTDPEVSLGYPIVPDSGGSQVTEAQMAGVYRDRQGTTFRFVQREEGMFLLREGRNDVLLEREGPNVFRQVYDPAFKQAFEWNPEGNLTVTAYYPTHPPYTLEKIASDFSQFDPGSLEGSYVNEETAVGIQLTVVDSTTYQVIRNDRESSGLLLTPTMMLTGGYTLKFDEEGNFLLDGDRIRNILFRKAE